MKLVIKVGGSLCIDENGPIFSYFKKLLPVLKLIDKENQLIVSVGGGKFIRKYYSAIKKLNLTNEHMEWIAIDLLRVNVRFLSFLLDKKSIYTLEEIGDKTEGVIGGIVPGRSTDANAAYAAAKIKSDYLIKLTDVDGIFEKDPKKFKAAKKLDRVSFNDLEKYALKGRPGSYGILDKTAIDIITKNKIRTAIINGRDPKNILKVLKGEKIGTIIS